MVSIEILEISICNNNYILVDDGAILDIIFENFSHSPPAGFEKIMLEQSLL